MICGALHALVNCQTSITSKWTIQCQTRHVIPNAKFTWHWISWLSCLPVLHELLGVVAWQDVVDLVNWSMRRRCTNNMNCARYSSCIFTLNRMRCFYHRSSRGFDVFVLRGISMKSPSEKRTNWAHWRYVRETALLRTRWCFNSELQAGNIRNSAIPPSCARAFAPDGELAVAFSEIALKVLFLGNPNTQSMAKSAAKGHANFGLQTLWQLPTHCRHSQLPQVSILAILIGFNNPLRLQGRS